MWKLGITSYEALASPLASFGRRRYASVLLLRDLAECSPPRPDLYDHIIKMVRVPNGTWKDTQAGRFATLDGRLLALLETLHPAGARLTVGDLAASSGATSVELYTLLKTRFALEFIATDLWCEAVAVRWPLTGWTVILDQSGHELQQIVGPFVLPGQGTEPIAYPINRLLRWLGRRLVVPRARRALTGVRARELEYFAARRLGSLEIVRVPLITRECLDLVRSDPNFRFESHDILTALPWSFDVLRAMNILTRDHLDDASLRAGIRHCVDALRMSGVLLLGRSPDGDPAAVRATCYRRTATGLEVAMRVGGGTEVEGLVAAVADVTEAPAGDAITIEATAG